MPLNGPTTYVKDLMYRYTPRTNKRMLQDNCLTDFEKDSIEKKIVTDIQQNKSVALEINAVNGETDKALKQSSNFYIKIPAIEKEFNK